VEVAISSQERKRAPSDECEADRDAAIESDEGITERLIKPVGKVIGLPPAGCVQLIRLEAEPAEIVEVERVDVLQPGSKVGRLLGVYEVDGGRHDHSEPRCTVYSSDTIPVLL
jgi:hypothetical protein